MKAATPKLSPVEEACVRFYGQKPIPVRLCTVKVLTSANKHGDTPLHIAALMGGLRKVPKKFLTKENVSIKNRTGDTALHYAAGNDHLNQLPKTCLTVENLKQKNHVGTTPLYLAAHQSRLFDIPGKLITAAGLVLNEGLKTPPAGIAIDGFTRELESIPVNVWKDPKDFQVLEQVLRERGLNKVFEAYLSAATLQVIPAPKPSS